MHAKNLTLSQLLLSVSTVYPDAGIIYAQGDDVDKFKTYSSLFDQATEALAELQSRDVKPGDKLISQVDSSEHLIIMFWACILGGIVPVLLPKVPAWSRDTETKRKFLAVWEVLNKPAVCVGAGQADELYAQLQTQNLPDFQLIELFGLNKTDITAKYHTASIDDLAYLQFSSGSTGTPKGVRLTHRNLICNTRDIITAAKLCTDDITLSWMPYFHDMGLIGFHLVPLYLGINQVKLEPGQFISNPFLWLRKINQYRASLIGSPNFGLQQVVNKVSEDELLKIDLSCVKLLYNGAEPISTITMNQFIEKLAVAKFPATAMFPVYGMAEACLAVTFSPVNQEPIIHKLDRQAFMQNKVLLANEASEQILEYVDVGYPLPSVEVKITNELNDTLGDGLLGEIYIRGDNVTEGYEGNNEANKELITSDGWLKTGDLGFFSNGRLTVTGRSRDVVIINGQNVMAHDIEESIIDKCGLKAGLIAASGVYDSNEGSEKVIIFIATRKKKLLWEWLLEIWETAQNYLRIPITYVIPVKNIPKTTSGKLQRYQLLNDYKNGLFKNEVNEFSERVKHLNTSLERELPQNQWEEMVLSIWENVLKKPKDKIGVTDAFMSIGGSSVKAVEMLTQIEKRAGNKYGYDILIQCKTIREIADYITEHNRETLFTDNNTHDSNTSKAVPKEKFIKENESKIAIIGMSGKFPGASNLDEYWNNLLTGKDSISDVTWEMEGNSSRKYYLGALDDLDCFAADFFGISNEEAQIMDPQQRMALEIAYQTLEDGGYTGERILTKDTGVYLGASYNSFMEQVVTTLNKDNEREDVNQFALTGNMLNMVAARISHVLDLKGPALAIDTACSSSLVALHYACNDLLLGNCDLALAGGVNVLLTPTIHELFSKTGALSKDGKCKVFDKDADGIVPGEGVGMVLLKPLNAALKDGDRIAGIIETVTVNNDGKSIGIMAPNPEGQERVLNSAFSKAGIQPSDIGYVEAHGTGTALGDPIEVRALSKVFGVQNESQNICHIGSVKSNIGHLFSAAGIAGLIKVLMAIRHEKLPPSLHYKSAHPHINFDKSSFSPLNEIMAWKKGEKTRYASISSFGFGGTNAHMIIREPLENMQRSNPDSACGHLLAISARKTCELDSLVKKAIQHIKCNTSVNISDLCFSWNSGRQNFSHRCFALGRTPIELAENLESNIKINTEGSIKTNRKTKRKIAFLLSGQGSQYAGMAHRLYTLHPVFKSIVDECCVIANKYLSDNIEIKSYLIEAVDKTKSDKPLLNTEAIQPSIFILEYAIAKYFISIGIKPSILIGHSLGEYVAACISGVFSLDDALRVVIRRAQLMQGMEMGAMLAVGLTEVKINKYLSNYAGKLSIAAVNTNNQCVISGPFSDIDRFKAELARDQVGFYQLPVSHAFHSSMMKPMIDSFKKVLSTVALKPARIPVVSNVTGEMIGKNHQNIDYWLEHILKPVRFYDSVNTLIKQDINYYLEVGPGSVLSDMVQKQLKESDMTATVLHVLNKKDVNNDKRFLNTIGTIWQHGWSINWLVLEKENDPRIIELPQYPLVRERYSIHTRMQRKIIGKRCNSKPIYPTDSNQIVKESRNKWLSTGRNPIDWFYQVEWKVVKHEKIDNKNLNPLIDSWIIFSEQCLSNDALEKHIERFNGKLVNVFWGSEFSKLNEHQYIVNPDIEDDFYKLWDYLKKDNIVPQSVIYNAVSDITSEIKFYQDVLKRVGGFFLLAKSIVKYFSNTDVNLTIVTKNTQAINTTDKVIDPVGAAIWGCAKSLSMESSRVKLKCIDVDVLRFDDKTASTIFEESVIIDEENQRFIALRNHVRYIQYIDSVKSNIIKHNNYKFIENGVYLITGGLGGIGFSIASYLVKQFKAKVILLTRKSFPETSNWKEYIDNNPDDISTINQIQKLQELKKISTDIYVKTVDITYENHVERLQAWLLTKFKKLNGVIHAAGLLNDKRIKDMGTNDFFDVLKPKMHGLDYLYRYTKNLNPDIHILFSSVVGITGNIGQSNHSAANSFEDSFGHWLNANGQKAVVINWGFWGDTGVVADKFHIDFLAKQKVYSMPADDAINALQHALSLGVSHCIVANLGLGFFAGYGHCKNISTVLSACESPRLSIEFLKSLKDYTEVESFINRRCSYNIFNSLTAAGLFVNKEDKYNFQSVIDLLKVKSEYELLLRRYLNILIEDGILQEDSDQLSINELLPTKLFECEAENIISKNTAYDAALKTLDRCTNSFVNVLNGNKHPIAVLFDRGSLDQLEEIYENLPVMKLGNAMLSSAVTKVLKQSNSIKNNSILEIGAGTGGLSAYLIPKLSQFNNVDYWYTDVGTSFINHGERKFNTYPFVTTSIFDISKNSLKQGFNAEQFNILVGSNVLHAVPDIRQTIKNLKKLIKPGGYLILVETTKQNRFADCTVGMLDGWWGFTDKSIRADYPLLSSQQWQIIFSQEGFSIDTIPVKYGTSVIDTDFSILIAHLPETISEKDNYETTKKTKVENVSIPKIDNDSLTDKIAEFIKAELVLLNIDISEDDVSFASLGLHSLVAVQFVNVINKKLNLELSPVALFEYDNVSLLSNYLHQDYGHVFTSWFDDSYQIQVPNIKHKQKIENNEYPLSSAQSRLWFLSKLQPDSCYYNMPGAIILEGELDIDILTRALQHVVQRQESLRTSFIESNGKAFQKILDNADIPLNVVDFSHLSQEEQNFEIKKLRKLETQQVFDLSKGALIRVKLAVLSDKRHLLNYVMHHIISDGWSMSVWVNEVANFYNAELSNIKCNLEPLKVQYKDYSYQQCNEIDISRMESQKNYWLSQLSGDLPVLDLPSDYIRPAYQAYNGDVVISNISSSITQRLNVLSDDTKVTPFMMMLSVWYLLMFKLLNQTDIIVGSPVANRSNKDIESLIGFFVNSLALRISIDKNQDFISLLESVKKVCIEAYKNQELPFDRLVEILNPVRDLTRSPIFNIMLIYQDSSVEKNAEFALNGIKLKVLPNELYTAKFDLQLFIKNHDDNISLCLEYNTDLFSHETAQRYLDYYIHLLNTVTDEPDLALKQYSLISKQDEVKLISQCSATHQHWQVKHQTLPELFEQQARTTPDHEAVVYLGNSLTYKELNSKSNQFARYLQTKGVGPEQFVGVYCERSIDMVIALIAILKTGGAYVPLDLEWPKKRLKDVINASGIKYIVSQDKGLINLEEPNVNIIPLSCRSSYKLLDVDNINIKISPENSAYMIYTSGSTGTPKGVIVPQEGVVNRLLWMQKNYNLTTSDRVLQKTPYTFDVSVWEFFWPLITGAKLVLAKPDGHKDRDYITEIIQHEKITTVHFVPSMLNVFMDAEAISKSTTLKRVICSGESLAYDSYKRFFKLLPFVELHNLYGPTEASIDVTYFKCIPDIKSKSIPIGRPINNVQVLVLDEEMKPVPIGVPGELYIGGIALARGYHLKADLTAEQFVPNPYSHSGTRLYRTGDCVRLMSDGNIEYISRFDHQVKIRGFRIETGEIESVIKHHPGIKDAVVVSHEDTTGDKRLLAYLVEDKLSQYKLQNDSNVMESDKLNQWKKIFDETYKETSTETNSFNIAGWISSYTGDAIPPVEMQEWVDNTVTRIQKLKGKHIIELGCGTGLLLFRLIDKCVEYYGSDISAQSISLLTDSLHNLDISNDKVKLIERSADNFSGIEEQYYDTLVMNSVVQYFPDSDYFLRVVQGALKIVKTGGSIFIGDVRNLALQNVFNTSVELFSAPLDKTVSWLSGRVKKRDSLENELVIHPAFFIALKNEYTQISSVEILPKDGSYNNELSKFRYDVILHVGGNSIEKDSFYKIDMKKKSLNINELEILINELDMDDICIQKIPNRRIEKELYDYDELINSDKNKTLLDFKSNLMSDFDSPGLDVKDVLSLGESLGYYSRVEYDINSDSMEYIVFYSRNKNALFNTQKHINTKRWVEYTNEVKLKSSGTKIITEVKSYIADNLPEYMVPSLFEIIEDIPLTVSGKVDRKNLPEPSSIRSDLLDKYIKPSSDAEIRMSEIWQEVLGLDRIGVLDSFFDLGGHSLLATQIISRIDKEFNTKLSLRKIFEISTIRELCEFIQKTGKVSSMLDGELTSYRKEKMDLTDLLEELESID